MWSSPPWRVAKVTELSDNWLEKKTKISQNTDVWRRRYVQFIIQQESCQRDLQVGIPEKWNWNPWMGCYLFYLFIFILFIYNFTWSWYIKYLITNKNQPLNIITKKTKTIIITKMNAYGYTVIFMFGILNNCNQYFWNSLCYF